MELTIRNKQLLLLVALLANIELLYSRTPLPEKPVVKSIFFEIKVCNIPTDSLTIFYRPFLKDAVTLDLTPVTSPVINGKATFQFSGESALYIYTRKIFPQNNNWRAEPGDSTIATIDKGKVSFTGKGSEKFRLLVEIDSATCLIPKPFNQTMLRTDNLEDFLTTIQYLNKTLAVSLKIIDRYRYIISQQLYTSVRTTLISEYQGRKQDKFNDLYVNAEKFKISNANLGILFDTCLNSKEWQWALHQKDHLSDTYGHIRALVIREHNFDFSSDSMHSSGKRRVLYYNRGSDLLSGRNRILFWVNLLTIEGIKEVGPTPEIQHLLDRFYAEPGLDAYKAYVRKYVKKARQIRTGRKLPPFALPDRNGILVSNIDFSNKLTILTFSDTNSIKNKQLATVLSRIKELYRKDTNIVFINISAEKNKKKWLEELSKNYSYKDNTIQLFTQGMGTSHPIFEDYNTTSFPSTFIINEHGRVLENPLPDPTLDGGKTLESKIKTRTQIMNDGPYAIYGGDSISIYSNDGDQWRQRKVAKGASASISISIDGSPLTIPLKKELMIEPSTYAAPARLVAMSDLEGNLQAFTRLLKACKVVDEKLNWSFSNGHLVLTGDIFDRGEQVTECLWLIYSLEDQAAKAGGKVHFILGNHEMMNLSENLTYMHEKYKKKYEQLKIPHSTLMGRQSEIGRWLRTKNIMERIGDLLFVHAGISDQVNNIPLSIEAINHLARTYYDRQADTSGIASTLFNSRTSPFWYRLYYQNGDEKMSARGRISRKATQQQINTTLSKFNVSRIITGHTIVSDSITSHFNGKVINIDLRHAEEKSEALLIDNNGYFRISTTGVATPLPAPEASEK